MWPACTVDAMLALVYPTRSCWNQRRLAHDRSRSKRWDYSTLTTETDRSIQQGYMQIFAGAMTGIRNPKAHGNLNPDSSKALHLIALASLLMHKIDERVE